MPGTTTTRLALYKPDATGVDNVNVVTDVNNNMDNLDSKVGFVACTSGTRPGAPYNGQAIRETDTSKYYIWNGAAWIQCLIGTAQFANALDVAGGATFTGGIVSAIRAAATDIGFQSKVVADAQQRLAAQVDGKLLWSSGAAGTDTNLYRSAVGTLKTDTAFLAVGDLSTSGKVNIGSAAIRPRLSTVTTVANTVTETIIATYTVNAGDSVAGSVYRLKVWGEASVLTATTPTLTFRFKLSGSTMSTNAIVITAGSGLQSRTWEVELYLAVITTGAGGTVRAYANLRESLSVATADPYTVINRMTGKTGGTTAMDTTVNRDITVSVQWSAASVSNTASAYIVAGEKVA